MKEVSSLRFIPEFSQFLPRCAEYRSRILRDPKMRLQNTSLADTTSSLEKLVPLGRSHGVTSHSLALRTPRRARNGPRPPLRSWWNGSTQ